VYGCKRLSDMRGFDAFEVGPTTLSREVLWRVHNRKLRTALLNAGVELGEFEDEIVEGASKVVTDLAEADRDIPTNVSVAFALLKGSPLTIDPSVLQRSRT
jgi:hypothetical protein